MITMTKMEMIMLKMKIKMKMLAMMVMLMMTMMKNRDGSDGLLPFMICSWTVAESSPSKRATSFQLYHQHQNKHQHHHDYHDHDVFHHHHHHHHESSATLFQGHHHQLTHGSISNLPQYICQSLRLDTKCVL